MAAGEDPSLGEDSATSKIQALQLTSIVTAIG